LSSNPNIRVLLALAGVLTAASSLLVSCKSNGGLDITFDPTGPSRLTWKPEGPQTLLPASWTPTSERDVEVEVKGRRYRVRICVATNPAEPTCIYTNSGGCGATEGWQKYCEVAVATEDPGDPVQLSFETTGAFRYDLASDVIRASFRFNQAIVDVPDNMIVATVTAGSIVNMPISMWESLYGPVPAGSIITLNGSSTDVIWDAMLLGVQTLSADTTEGVVHAAITHDAHTPPIFVVALNGEVVRSEFIGGPD
jgi:hypothetical protein